MRRKRKRYKDKRADRGEKGQRWGLWVRSTLTRCRQFPITLLGSGQAEKRAGTVLSLAVVPR